MFFLKQIIAYIFVLVLVCFSYLLSIFFLFVILIFFIIDGFSILFFIIYFFNVLTLCFLFFLTFVLPCVYFGTLIIVSSNVLDRSSMLVLFKSSKVVSMTVFTFSLYSFAIYISCYFKITSNSNAKVPKSRNIYKLYLQ